MQRSDRFNNNSTISQHTKATSIISDPNTQQLTNDSALTGSIITYSLPSSNTYRLVRSFDDGGVGAPIGMEGK
jgi:hypothetical protein